MKKLVLVAAVMVVGAGSAFGSSLAIPWFLDNAPSDGSFPPRSGSASYIAITNNTDQDIVAAVTYFDSAVTKSPATPANNTFILRARQTLSFRPRGDDPITEVGATVVPNMTGTLNAGSATISWVGGPSDIQGRLVQSQSDGGTFAFLLPPGF